MNTKEQVLGMVLGKIADELNISDKMYNKAVSSYEAVGKWLGEGPDWGFVIMPQGSMNLGTVIRPIDDRDDYDIDLVCLLNKGKGLQASTIKRIVGDRLKENKTYAGKLKPEGRRCWTMDYDEFHMDILPCVPNGIRYRNPDQTVIDLTDKDKTTGRYSFCQSNPAAYHDWFLKQAQPLIKLMNEAMGNAEITPVPSNASRLKTPLQRSIQLLKRHRDIMFSKQPENAPISIIITTLAAKACPHEINVYVALKTIVEKMHLFVERRNDGYWVPNPVLPNENFAEKWNYDPAKRQAFVSWLARAKTDFIDKPFSANGLDELAKLFKVSLGNAPVTRAFSNLGDSVRSSREKGSLRLTGLTSGLAIGSTASGTIVRQHTFYGS